MTIKDLDNKSELLKHLDSGIIEEFKKLYEAVTVSFFDITTVIFDIKNKE